MTYVKNNYGSNGPFSSQYDNPLYFPSAMLTLAYMFLGPLLAWKHHYSCDQVTADGTFSRRLSVLGEKDRST